MADLSIAMKSKLTSEQFAFVESGLAASFQISSVIATDDGIRIHYPDNECEESLRSTAKRYLFIAKSMEKDLIFENEVDIRFQEDPQPQLERKRDVIPIAPGFFTLQGGFLRVFHALNKKVKEIADELNAIEQEYPTVWPVRLFKKINYFHEFPQQVILCAPVKADFASREEFGRRYAKDESYDSIQMDDLIANAEYGLEAAVCDCCYYGLEGMTGLENAFYTCYNKVFRNERSGSNQLDRLTNFSVRDIMFVGTEVFVLESRQILIEALCQFVRDLALHAKIETANDPFFANDSAMKTVFQNANGLKYEILAFIPHLDREIAVGSINFHTDFFGEAFNIEAANGRPACSGCIGVGMERMAYALFCQHGASVDGWPGSVKDYLGLSE